MHGPCSYLPQTPGSSWQDRGRVSRGQVGWSKAWKRPKISPTNGTCGTHCTEAHVINLTVCGLKHHIDCIYGPFSRFACSPTPTRHGCVPTLPHTRPLARTRPETRAHKVRALRFTYANCSPAHTHLVVTFETTTPKSIDGVCSRASFKVSKASLIAVLLPLP